MAQGEKADPQAYLRTSFFYLRAHARFGIYPIDGGYARAT